ncbi:chemotaxis protein [Undibacterium squillarum]|uniref:chemotaxis protein n=1 Tax=Undibacterium squillarum TaxID=1131567 RepID=UPI0035ADCA5B
MSEKKLIGSQVKQLLSGVSDHGRAHLLEVETDLAQTALLLGEAIEKLGVSFMAMHEAVLKEQQEIDVLISEGNVPPQAIEKIREIQNEISQHVNAAVTSLQFQDLTSQLISRTIQRCEGLREVLNLLGAENGQSQNEEVSENIEQILLNAIARLEKQSNDLQAVLRKAVHQKHLDSGDIELF